MLLKKKKDKYKDRNEKYIEAVQLKKDKLCKFSPNNINYATQKLLSQKHLSINCGESEEKQTTAGCIETALLHIHISIRNKTFFIYNDHLMLNILESLEPMS